jgi:hypothetical protein
MNLKKKKLFSLLNIETDISFAKFYMFIFLPAITAQNFSSFALPVFVLVCSYGSIEA